MSSIFGSTASGKTTTGGAFYINGKEAGTWEVAFHMLKGKLDPTDLMLAPYWP
jgi:hypothetical protein